MLAIFKLPVSQYPDISPPTVQISGIFNGADAQTVEQTVTTPIESQVNGTPGMAYMQGNSTSDGRTTINVILNVGTDPNIAALDVQNRVGIATPLLPDDVKRLGLVTRKRTSSILLLVAMYSPGGTHERDIRGQLYQYFRKRCAAPCSAVSAIFLRERMISACVCGWNPINSRSSVLPQTMSRMHLTEQNLQIAAGAVGAPPQKSNQAFEYTVFTNSRLNSEEQFGKMIVRANTQEGSVVHLKDVARIQLGKFSYANNSFVDGKRASYLLIFQAPGSNALDVAQGIYTTMNQLKKSFPKDIDYVVPFESVSVVKVSIDEVVMTLLEALGLVVLVVFLFLQSGRATLIPVLAIPVSLIGTFAFFIPLGFTINTLTMFGFVLAIGIVVDDAIIVVEAVQHYIDREGLSPVEATTKAMKDISGPVVAIALILAAVFVPVSFMPGIVGRLYQQFAITIAVSVLISAFVALSLTPALCTLFLKPTQMTRESKGLRKLFFRFNEWFQRTTGSYAAGVKKCIDAAPFVLIMLICLYAGTVLLFKNKPTGFIPTEDEGRVYVTFELPEASSTSRTLDVLNSVMEILKQTPGIAHYAALGGLNVVTFATKSNSGTVFVQLKPWDERTDKSLQLGSLIAALQRKFSSIEGANILVISPPAIPGSRSHGRIHF